MVTLPLFEETGRRGAGAAGSEGVTSLFLPQRTLPRVFFSFPYTFYFLVFYFFLILKIEALNRLQNQLRFGGFVCGNCQLYAAQGEFNNASWLHWGCVP